MGKVYRKQRIEGVTVPAIIHNRQYFWHNMAVYEDGTVSCWEKTDLCDVIRQLERGWLTFSVPAGSALSVHGLCTLEIVSANWNFDNESYLQFIEDTVRTINPEMANIYETTPREKEMWKERHIGFVADPTPFKVSGNFGYETLNGKQMNVFLRKDGEILLTSVTAFADGTFSVDGFDEEYVSLERIQELFDEDTLCTSSKENESVSFGALGNAVCKIIYNVNKAEKLKELENESLRMMNKPDAFQNARQAYFNYLAEPSEFHKNKLREAYEAVPEHQRMYLGDMDTRDSDYIRILYTNDKREV